MENTKLESKKLIYLALLGIALVLVTVVTIILVNNDRTVSVVKEDSQSATDSTKDSQSGSDSTSNSQSSVDSSSDSGDDSSTTKPTVIEFIEPVKNGSVIKEYAVNTVVYNQTLGVYTGHYGIDYAGSEGAKVLAVYDGKIESIVTNYLTGTTLTINHGNGLKSVYNSIDVLETLSIGDSVSIGQEIGTLSTNNKQEYKDGAHLHFEVYENGQNISPTKYMTESLK